MRKFFDTAIALMAAESMIASAAYAGLQNPRRPKLKKKVDPIKKRVRKLKANSRRKNR